MIQSEYYLIRNNSKYIQRKRYLDNLKYKAYIFFTASNGDKYIKYIGEYLYSDTVISDIINFNDRTCGFFPKTIKFYTEFPYELDGFDIDDIELRITDKYIRKDVRYIECPITPYCLNFLGRWIYERCYLHKLITKRNAIIVNGLNRNQGEFYQVLGKFFKSLFIYNGYDDEYINKIRIEKLFTEKPHILHKTNWMEIYQPEEHFAFIYLDELDTYLDNMKCSDYRYCICKKQEQE